MQLDFENQQVKRATDSYNETLSAFIGPLLAALEAHSTREHVALSGTIAQLQQRPSARPFGTLAVRQQQCGNKQLLCVGNSESKSSGLEGELEIRRRVPQTQRKLPIAGSVRSS